MTRLRSWNGDPAVDSIAFERQVESLRDEWLRDAEKLADANDRVANGHQAAGDNLLDSIAALADLDDTDPSALIGSDLLARLYRIGRQFNIERRDALYDMAVEHVESELSAPAMRHAEAA